MNWLWELSGSPTRRPLGQWVDLFTKSNLLANGLTGWPRTPPCWSTDWPIGQHLIIGGWVITVPLWRLLPLHASSSQADQEETRACSWRAWMCWSYPWFQSMFVKLYGRLHLSSRPNGSQLLVLAYVDGTEIGGHWRFLVTFWFNSTVSHRKCS